MMNDHVKSSVPAFDVRRFETNPLITPELSPSIGDNINGPSVIRVPSWLPNPLGKYYMYFAHHSGTYIRLAYADSLEGPWTIYEPGTLQLVDAQAFHDHIASPDVHVDNESKQIRMYFHGPSKNKPGQWTGIAYSEDGVRFTAKNKLLGKFYFRVWQWQDHWYALAKNNNEGWGELYRAPSPDGPFTLRGNFLKDMRHAAVIVDEHTLRIFYSRVGDAPEMILMASVDMNEDWLLWHPTEPIEVLQPREICEGSLHPISPSESGPAVGVQQLRDPYVMSSGDKNAEMTMFYTGAGEECICSLVLVSSKSVFTHNSL